MTNNNKVKPSSFNTNGIPLYESLPTDTSRITTIKAAKGLIGAIYGVKLQGKQLSKHEQDSYERAIAILKTFGETYP